MVGFAWTRLAMGWWGRGWLGFLTLAGVSWIGEFIQDGMSYKVQKRFQKKITVIVNYTFLSISIEQYSFSKEPEFSE